MKVVPEVADVEQGGVRGLEGLLGEPGQALRVDTQVTVHQELGRPRLQQGT